MEKTLDKMTDLELAKILGQLHTQAHRINADLINVNAEITKREPIKEEKSKEPVIEEVKV